MNALSKVCTECTVGKMSTSGSSSCTDCEKGQYANLVIKATKCDACGPGKYGDQILQNSINSCKNCNVSYLVKFY